MKYLKSFNESRQLVSLRRELKTLCDEYLPFLKDNGYTIFLPIDKVNGTNVIVIMIIKEGLDNNGKARKFKWIDIKDDLLPFYELLKSRNNIIGDIGLNGWITVIPNNEIESISDDKELTDIRISIGL